MASLNVDERGGSMWPMRVLIFMVIVVSLFLAFLLLANAFDNIEETVTM